MSTAVFQVAGSTPDLEAGRSQIAHLVTAGSSKDQLVRALLMLSYASLFVGMSAGIHKPAATGSVFAHHQAAYYSVIAALLAAVPLEMATAFWLPRSHGLTFQSFAEVLQRVGVVLLIVVSAVGGIELSIKV